jgi:hypothetical protein
MLQSENTVTRRLSKLGLGIVVGAILLAVCLCSPAWGQEADTSDSLQADPPVSLSADNIISTLRQDPELLQQVRNVVIQKAQEQGRSMNSGNVTDESLFRLIREDRSVRTLAAREIEDDF